MTNAITTYTAHFEDGKIQTTSAEQAEEWARDGVKVKAVTTTVASNNTRSDTL